MTSVSKNRRTFNRHVADEGVSRKRGLCFVPLEVVLMDDIILLKMGEQIGVENIRAASKMSHKVVVFVSRTCFVDVVVQLTVYFWEMTKRLFRSRQWTLPLKKKTLSNVPPFLSNEVIQQRFGDYGTVVCRIITFSLRMRNDKLKHRIVQAVLLCRV